MAPPQPDAAAGAVATPASPLDGSQTELLEGASARCWLPWFSLPFSVVGGGTGHIPHPGYVGCRSQHLARHRTQTLPLTAHVRSFPRQVGRSLLSQSRAAHLAFRIDVGVVDGAPHETGRPMTSRIPHNSDGESGARADDHGLNSVP